MAGLPNFKSTVLAVFLVSGMLALALSFWALSQSSGGTGGTLPHPVYLTAVPFTDRQGAETLEQTASSPVTKPFNNTSATWISLQTYDEGTTFQPGNMKFSISYRAASCDQPQYCKVSVDWGWCAADCSTLSPEVTFTHSRFTGDNADVLYSSNPAQVVLTGCPCHVYVKIDSKVASRHGWTLVYGSTSFLQMPLQTGGALGQVGMVIGLFAIGFLAMFPIVPLVSLVAWIYNTIRRNAWRSWRRRCMVEFAQANGLTFVGDLSVWQQTDVPIPSRPHTSRRRSDTIRNLITGNWRGLQISCGDSVDENQGTWYSVARVEIPANLPSVSIVPGGSGGNVRLESYEFDQRFALTAQSPQFAFQLIDARMIESLVANPSIGYEVAGSTVRTYCPGMATPEVLLDALLQFLQSVPRLVWTQYGSEPAA